MKSGLKYVLVLLMLSTCIAVCVSGQAEVLTNTRIIEMTRAGLSADIIRRSITRSNTKFDVSAAGLIELKKAEVANDVITAMIDRQDDASAKNVSGKLAEYSENGTPAASVSSSAANLNKKEIVSSARTIAFVKSSAHPSRQALEKELLKRPDFQAMNLTITRYKENADLYVEIGYVSLSWLTHRYVYRIFDRRTGTVIAAGETTSWGSLAENLARNIAKSLTSIRTS